MKKNNKQNKTGRLSSENLVIDDVSVNYHTERECVEDIEPNNRQQGTLIVGCRTEPSRLT